MIAYLRGQLRDKGLNYVVLENAGVGYRIFVGATLWSELVTGQETELYIHHQIREDASDLYGFKLVADLELFELLLSVSGIGPKSALGILSLASAEDVRLAIMRDDAGLLTKVSGVGKKTAERLVLELKNKVAKLGGTIDVSGNGLSVGGDELDALISLGYSASEARAALNLVGAEISDSGERVKAALRRIRRS